MALVALALAAALHLLRAAAACGDLCGTALEAKSVSVPLAVTPGCDCRLTLRFSNAPALGSLVVSGTPGAASFSVFNSADASPTSQIAELGAAMLDFGGLTLFSATGTFEVIVRGAASVAPGAKVAVVLAADNQPPILGLREGADFNPGTAGFYIPADEPWIPLPVTLDDFDGHGELLFVLVELELIDPAADRSVMLVLPSEAVGPDLVVEVGPVDEQVSAISLVGPGPDVERAVAGMRLVPLGIGLLDQDYIVINAFEIASGLSAVPAESGSFTTYFPAYNLQVYPTGTMHIPREQDLLTFGSNTPRRPTAGQFIIHDAFRLQVTGLSLDGLYGQFSQTCFEFIRVWDGPDVSVATLVSTEFALSGEVCGLNDQYRPTYLSATGTFVVEFSLLDDIQSHFVAAVSHVPADFTVFSVVQHELGPLRVAKGGDAVSLPRILVASLPDPNELTVKLSATSGSVSLRYPESFVDLISPSRDGTIALTFSVDTVARRTSALHRLTLALEEAQFVPPTHSVGEAAVVVVARSGGQETEMVLPVVISDVAIDTPRAASVHVYRPSALAAHFSAAGGSDQVWTVVVSCTTGIGQLSVDARALEWIDVGFAQNITLTGTASELNARLATLVYKASIGGQDTVVVAVGGVSASIAITVDFECSGPHFIYARQGSFTDRTGPPADRNSGLVSCNFVVVGSRVVSFPYFELQAASLSDPPEFFSVSHFSGPLFFLIRQDPGVLESPQAFFEVIYDALGYQSKGFVVEFAPSPSINDPPVLVVPSNDIIAVRGSVIRLPTLFVSDFSDDEVHVVISTSAGALQQPGQRVVEIRTADFDELDTWISHLDFIAVIPTSAAALTATITVEATDGQGASQAATFGVAIQPCQGSELVSLADASARAVVSDGSGAADYSQDTVCSWILVGAAAPAVLAVRLLDLDCTGDSVDVYDGTSLAGRSLGSFCSENQLLDSIGGLTSATGSFFVLFRSDSDLATVRDGFEFEYSSLGSRSDLALGAAPSLHDPDRTNATVVVLADNSVLVVAGHNRVRAVASVLRFSVLQGWAVVPTEEGSHEFAPRAQAAGSVLSGPAQSEIVLLHGGVDLDGTVLAETWAGQVGDASIRWTPISAAGPRTASAAMHAHRETGTAYLADASGIWMVHLDLSGPVPNATGPWTLVAPLPDVIAASGIVYDAARGGALLAVGTDNALWRMGLDVPEREWHMLVALGPGICDCIPMMLGPDELVVGTKSVNLTRLTVEESAAAPAAGHRVSGRFHGHPALFVYADGRMHVWASVLEVSSSAPRVAPVTGQTEVSLHGDRLSTCRMARCLFGDVEVPARVASERVAVCSAPAGAAGVVRLALACQDDRRFLVPSLFGYHGAPSIESIEPARPEPGESLLVAVAGIAADVFELVTEPLCLFGSQAVTATLLDWPELRCRVPNDIPAGQSLALAVSLDGQQFVGEAREVQIGRRSHREPLFDKSQATIAGLILAGVLFVVFGTLFWLSPTRPTRSIILMVPMGVIDLFFDVVFASKLRDEGSGLFLWSSSLLGAVLALNMVLVMGFFVRMVRSASGAAAFVHWLASAPRAVLAVSFVCLVSLVRVRALALLTTRLANLAMFDAAGIAAHDLHILGMLDVGGSLLEDLSQLVIQILYVGSDDARIDLVTVVSMVLSVGMIVVVVFQGAIRTAVVCLGQHKTSPVHPAGLKTEELS